MSKTRNTLNKPLKNGKQPFKGALKVALPISYTMRLFRQWQVTNDFQYLARCGYLMCLLKAKNDLANTKTSKGYTYSTKIKYRDAFSKAYNTNMPYTAFSTLKYDNIPLSPNDILNEMLGFLLDVGMDNDSWRSYSNLIYGQGKTDRNVGLLAIACKDSFTQVHIDYDRLDLIEKHLTNKEMDVARVLHDAPTTIYKKCQIPSVKDASELLGCTANALKGVRRSIRKKLLATDCHNVPLLAKILKGLKTCELVYDSKGNVSSALVSLSLYPGANHWYDVGLKTR